MTRKLNKLNISDVTSLNHVTGTPDSPLSNYKNMQQDFISLSDSKSFTFGVLLKEHFDLFSFSSNSLFIKTPNFTSYYNETQLY